MFYSFPVGSPRSNARCLSTSQERSWWGAQGTNNTQSLSNKGERPISSRIHILGVGNVGTFVAHSLADVPSRPPITLLLHNTRVYETWKENRARISVVKNGTVELRYGYDINVFRDATWHSLPTGKGTLSEHLDDEIIDSLIVSVKATQTVRALMSVKHRLTPDSTILFLQNGMGIIEQVNEKVWPDPETRPNYLMGTTSHGVYRLRPFNVVHNGMGTTIVGIPNSDAQSTIPPQNTENDTNSVPISNDSPPTTRHLIHTLTRAPALAAVNFNHSELLQQRLEKLAINAVINPLTVMLDCTNGELLYNFFLSRVMRLLLIEISTVICAMPELQGVPGVQARFAPERLRTLVIGVARKTASNTSSMLNDIQYGNTTEINFINNYIVQRGEELGIKCALNYMMVQLVLGKSKNRFNKMAKDLPMDLSGFAELEEDES